MTLNFNDSIYAQDVLNAFVATLAPLRAFSRDLSGATAAVGNAVYVPRIDAVTATTFNQSYTGTGGTVNTITVSLDKHRIQTIDLTDVQQLNSSAAKIENFARQQGQALAKIVLQDIWSVITTTNFGAAVVTTAASNWSKTQVRALRKQLSQSNVDLSQVSLVLDTETHDALLGDSTINQAYAYGGAEAIREGRIPRLMGFNVYESNVIPLNSISLTAFACHPDAIAVAMRNINTVVPDGVYQGLETLTDPASGISMGYRRYYDGGTGKVYASVECLFGYAAGLTPGLKIATVP
jgi:hypothetical protein